MYANVTCHPPLGHPTIVPCEAERVSFNVAIEASHRDSSWEVSLWHNFASQDDWREIHLHEATKNPFTISQSENGSNHQRRWFSGELRGKPSRPRTVSFTIKFRTRSMDGWKWVRDYSGLQDGQLYYQFAGIDENLSFYLPIPNGELQVEKVSSESPGSRVWFITGRVEPAYKESPGRVRHKIGIPLAWTHWFAVTRLWTAWIAPRQGCGLPLAEKDAVLYSFLRNDGLHVVLLAISGIDDVLTTLNYEDDSLVVASRNDQEEEGIVRVVAAVGNTFEGANAAVMYHARKIVGLSIAVPEDVLDVMNPLDQSLNTVNTTWVQDWYDGFTYCTWNGLGQNLTEEKISNALNSLKNNDIHISTLIIDDNWQSLDRTGDPQWMRGWTEFEANKQGFPEGLAKSIATIRQKHPQIAQIAVWHALLGYWGGISPDGELAKKYKTIEVEKTPTVSSGPLKMLVIDAEDVSRFYRDFYDFLSSAGITAVKTDAQFMLDELSSAKDRRSLTNVYYDTWVTEQLRHFYGKAISCMSQTPPILFRCQLPSNQPMGPVRNSDDFFPEIEDSHPWHIFCNAHNAVFAQHLNVLPDWDMFQTDHPWAGFHAAARCVSGGPIYITDEPGKHNVDLIHQMTAKTTQGQTVVLRPSTVGKSTEVYTGYEAARLLRVGTYAGVSTKGTGFLGIFNCRSAPITEIVTILDFPGTEYRGDYIVRSHTTGRVSDVMKTQDADSVICLQIEKYGWEILSSSPVAWIDLPAKKSPIGVVNLGLLGKMTGGAAITNTEILLEEKPNGRLRIRTFLKALGTLGVWLSKLPKLDLKNDLFITILDKPIAFALVSKSDASDKVLEIDIGEAWKEGGFQSGYSNEVQVDIFVRVQ